MLYQLVAVALVVILFVRNLRAGRLSLVAAAIISAAVAPAVVLLIPVPNLPIVLLLVAGLYMIVREAVAAADDPANRRG